MASKDSAEISGEVRITGIINDEEFAATGRASGNPSTGKYSVELDYENVPNGWHPFMYTDVKVGLLFLREEKGGKSFLGLTGGAYRSAGTIDLGDGNILRNNTNIRMTSKDKFVAVYVMTGTAHTGDVKTMEYFEETMLPLGPGRIAALAIARWKTANKKSIDAIFSTRYMFDSKYKLNGPQVRRLEAEPSLKAGRFSRTSLFSSTYTGFVRALPKAVEEGGPYIGNLIA